MSDWYDDLEPEELERVYRLVAQSEGCLRNALTILDGRGDEHRDRLAEALTNTSGEAIAFDGARQLAGDDE